MAKVGAVKRCMRVAVVDSDLGARLCFRDILKSEERFCFAGGFSSADEALTVIPRLKPDMALVDISLPDMDGKMRRRIERDYNKTAAEIIHGGIP